MSIVVCPLSKVTENIASRTPERIVSLLDPGDMFPELGSAYAERHLRLSFHDIHIPTVSQVMPSAKQVDDLIIFLEAWVRTTPVLIHCRAGIGRSPAAAFIAACLKNPESDEFEIATLLRRISPLSRPNETLVGLADRAMNRKGRMSAAITATGRDLPWTHVDEGEPFEMPSDIQPDAR